MKQRIIAMIAVLAICGIAVATVAQIPAEQITAVLHSAAWLSVGLRQPQQSVQLLEEHISAPPAASVGGALYEQNVILGDIVTQAVPSLKTGVPEKAAGAGTVLTQQLSAGSSFIQDVAYKNNTKQTVDMAAALGRRPEIAFSVSETKPQVLITHTHTTECYLPYDAGFYNPDDASRTTDSTANMVAVGERVAEQLRHAGIGVVHDTEIHDQPYDTAYTQSRKAVEAYLKEYPSICVVLDIHRDAIYPNDTTRVKPTAVINGKKAAQLMIIVGMMNTKKVPNTHTAENLAFGARLQQTMHRRYRGLMRPMVLANARYNQQLSNGMILVEVGSDVNTLEEACYAAELLGQGLIETLKGL
ncbi:MAG: stage II sporulation protein P [Clostridia bacterium]|nr:stage II sporulation protein P [Clostridia bacterium]